jgi:hypothetical protein
MSSGRELSAVTFERAARHERLVREMRRHRQNCCGGCSTRSDGVRCPSRSAADRQRIDRYLDAFERGRLDADKADERIRDLSDSKRSKEVRVTELKEQLVLLETAGEPIPDLAAVADVVERVLRGPMDPQSGCSSRRQFPR